MAGKKLVGTPQRRQFVRYAKVKGVSERRSCGFAQLPRSTFRYETRAKASNGLVECLKETAHKHPRFGYRRLHAMAKRAGHAVNHKRVYRLCKEQGLSVRRRAKRKSTLPKQERPNAATEVNHVRQYEVMPLWTVDFVQDQLQSGRKVRMLTVTDEYTRQSLAITIGFSLKSKDVASTLSRLIAERGAPKFLRSDNGSEFVALALRGFLNRSGVSTAYIDKGSPWQNGFAESFHSRFRDEFLNCEVFLSLADAAARTEVWRRWYNQERPHGSLKYASPNTFAENAKKEKANRETNAGTNTDAGT